MHNIFAFLLYNPKQKTVLLFLISSIPYSQSNFPKENSPKKPLWSPDCGYKLHQIRMMKMSHHQQWKRLTKLMNNLGLDVSEPPLWLLVLQTLAQWHLPLYMIMVVVVRHSPVPQFQLLFQQQLELELEPVLSQEGK